MNKTCEDVKFFDTLKLDIGAKKKPNHHNVPFEVTFGSPAFLMCRIRDFLSLPYDRFSQWFKCNKYVFCDLYHSWLKLVNQVFLSDLVCYDPDLLHF